MQELSRRDREFIADIAANCEDALYAEASCVAAGDLLQAADWAETAVELSEAAFRIAARSAR